MDIYNHDTLWGVLCGTGVIWVSAYCVMQIQVQRYCSMESKKKARQTLYYNLPGLLLIAVLAVACGIVIYAKYHACDPITLGHITRHDQVHIYYIIKYN